MKPDELRRFLETEEEKPFSGWDFSYLNNRIVAAPIDWSYPSIVLLRLRIGRPPRSLLDMGTGGGEFFSTLHPFPQFTCATEAYPPNVPIARERLEPLGVQVVPIDEDDPELPFADRQFELVINRHEYYSPEEVHRILEPGGTFITQQVGDRNDRELIEMLGAESRVDDPWEMDAAAAALEEAGLKVLEAKESLSETRVYDTGAIVYYFKALPWDIPDFSVDNYFDALVRIQKQIDTDGFVRTTLHRFLIIASRP